MEKTTPPPLLRCRPFLLIWAAVFASTAGGFLLLLSLSVALLETTGSNFVASAVFATQWLPAIFVAPVVAWLSDRHPPRRLLVVAEACGGICTLAAGWFHSDALAVLFALLLIRGLFDAVTKAERLVALKRHVPAESIEKAASLFGTAIFTGMGVGALAGAALVQVMPIPAIAALDAVTFLIAALCYRALGPEAAAFTPEGPRIAFGRIVPEALEAIGADRAIARNFGYLVLAAGIFQGYHNVVRTLLPVDHLGLGPAGAMYLQAVSAVAFVAGALFVARFMQTNGQNVIAPSVPVVATVFTMLLPLAARDPLPGLAAYALFLCVFEAAFTYVQKNLITSCPPERIGILSAFANAASTAAIVSTIFVAGWLSDHVDLFSLALLMAATALAGTAAIEMRYRRHPRLAPVPGTE